VGIVLVTSVIFHGICSGSEPGIEETVVFEEATNGFVLYRIPGVVVTARGTVLAYCEARKFSGADRGEIEIHVRRSTDGGRTFGPVQHVAHLGTRLPRNPHLPKSKQQKDMGGPNEQTVNNPVAISLRNGVVQLLYCVEYMRCFSIRSDDDGKRWSEPVEITAAFESFRDKLDWQVIATGPGHGIELSTGRLIVPFWMASYDEQAPLQKATGVIFSDDGGATWQGGEIAIPLAGEPNVAELSDGRTLMTARNGDRRNQRIAATSVDGATNWSTPKFLNEIPELGCMAGMVSHPAASGKPERLLLFSNPNATSRKHQDRRDVTIRLSRDNGNSWPIAKTLRHGPSAYSDLAVLPDGTILCFFEAGTTAPRIKRKRDWAYATLTMARFDLDWLTPTRGSEGSAELGRVESESP
jgi:sialidase-1